MVLGIYDYIPSIKDISVSSLQSAIQQSIVGVKAELYSVVEPLELRTSSKFDIEAKEKEIISNLTIF